ncbi:hypothetical protein D910_03605 [Dendroctonus ponderosae]|uniref:Cuticle protein n=1 Tax=Dendroctonus ponderosae TaxID=77166 RepID=U4TZC3_DENPD|nr:hypothetical protein D910_03605 [Dendroctonus ponderosae]
MLALFRVCLNFEKSDFETSNGIKKSETGDEIPSIHDANNDAALAKGSFSYTGADGVLYSVEYVADEAGFHPEGAHLKNVNLEENR